jgi:hypothetical protein
MMIRAFGTHCQEPTSTSATTGTLQIGRKPTAELITVRIGTQRLCLKERGKFVGPSFLVIRILLKPALQHSLDSLLRFRPRQRGLKRGDGVEETVGGRQRNLVDETLRGGDSGSPRWIVPRSVLLPGSVTESVFEYCSAE